MSETNSSTPDQPRRWAKLGMLSGIVVYAVLLFFSILVHEWNFREVGYTAVLGLAGLILGWGIGFVLSPDTRKGIELSRNWMVILAFLGGYVFSRIEPTLLYFFQNDVLIKNPTYGIRMIIFLICTIIAVINMYIYRRYLDEVAKWLD